jgi:hypothetical protein
MNLRHDNLEVFDPVYVSSIELRERFFLTSTEINKFSMLTLTDENQYLMTCRDLIEFHNGQYFELVKEKLDEFIEEIKEEYIV